MMSNFPGNRRLEKREMSIRPTVSALSRVRLSPRIPDFAQKMDCFLTIDGFWWTRYNGGLAEGQTPFIIHSRSQIF